MVGTGASEATQEIHIFLLPLDPDEATLKRYYAAVQEWNDKVLPELKSKGISSDVMKACHLALIFRSPDGSDKEVCVMQSARYIRSNDPKLVVEQCHEDAEWFISHGFEVVREKIEASAYGIQGIPQTDDDAKRLSRYFEFHIKVKRKDRADDSPIIADEVTQLKAISVAFSRQYKVPVPLSYNKNKECKAPQRFLNLRFRDMGIASIKPLVKQVEQAIEADTAFTVMKTISEYVWFDTYSEMDRGWIDYSPEELVALLA